MCLFIITSAIAVITLIIAIIKIRQQKVKMGLLIWLLVITTVLNISASLITYINAHNAEANAIILNKATKLNVILGSYTPEVQKNWILYQNELNEELKASKSEVADRVLAQKSWGLAIDYLQKGDAKACIEFCDYSLYFVVTGAAHNTKGLALYNTDTTRAIKECSLALRLNPNLPSANNNLGLFVYGLGLYDYAERHFLSSIKLNPFYAPAHLNLGNTLSKKGDSAGAVKQFQETINLDPDNYRGHMNLGSELTKIGKYEDGLKALYIAANKNPKDAEVFFNIGVNFAKQRKFKEAISAYERAINLNPDHAGAHNNNGNVLLILGKTEAAINEYKEAIRSEPGWALPVENLAKAKAKAKQEGAKIRLAEPD